MKFRVNEIFHSIQGESTLAGQRMSFVRLTGCPLRCTYCDTKYSYYEGDWMTVPQILDTIRPHEAPWVMLTGGEPLAHPNADALVRAFRDEGKQVSIETSGEQDISKVVDLAKIILDVKTPGSGEIAKKCFENFKLLKPSDEIKFVISHEDDFSWAKKVCADFGLFEKHHVLFSPVFENGILKDLAEWMVRDRLPGRLQTQLHKHVWTPTTRGV